MLSLSRLLHSRDNLGEVAYILFQDLKVKVTQTTLTQFLLNHPYYPSLAALNDVLGYYRVESVVLKDCDLVKLRQTSESFLAQIRSEGNNEMFAYVYKMTDNGVYWYNPYKHHKETIEYPQFSALFTGYVMLFDESDKADEENYQYKRREEVIGRLLESFLFLFLPIVSVISLAIYILDNHNCFLWYVVIYTMLLLTGYLLGFLLILYEYNQYSPVLSKICNLSSKTNCSAILNSGSSHILGISWSVIGTAYFTGVLMAFLISGFSLSMLSALVLLHLFVLPYIGYSIYYQYHIARRWCPLCLAIQAVLLLMFVCALCSGIYLSAFQLLSTTAVVPLTISFVSSFSILQFLWHLSQQLKLRQYYEQSLLRLKYNKVVFSALLNKEPFIEVPSEHCGLILGNPNGNIHVVKVCNPFCSHCAKAQPILQQIVNHCSDVRLQIIFAVDPTSDYYKRTPIDHFLSQYYEGDDMESILTAWYSSVIKDVELFKDVYRLKQQSVAERNRLNAENMFQFCKKASIKGTPTIFVNGHQLPDIYRISDLRYLIKLIV